ncbi:MAG: hypothetical protein DWP92_06020, partial [Armatimonadetes bacterium]
SLACAGDVNNDGITDIIVGTSQTEHVVNDAGKAFIYSGTDGTLIREVIGLTVGDNFGWDVDGVGDLNQDGYADVIIGAPNDQGIGSVSLVSGLDGSTIHYILGMESLSFFGKSVSGLNDIDDDGIEDFIVGAPSEDNTGSNSGAARLYSGATAVLIRTHLGAGLTDGLGGAVARLGDADGDQVGDYAIGAGGSDVTFPNAGAVYVYSGLTGTEIFHDYGSESGEQLGIAVSFAGDIDSDGRADVIAGAWKSDAGGTDMGEVLAYSGASGAILYSLVSSVAGFGFSLDYAGDVNSDNRPDFLVGAPLTSGGVPPGGAAYVYSSSCSNPIVYGAGCPGTGGYVPSLSLQGCGIPGTSVQVLISNGLGNAPSLIIVGPDQVDLPLGAGCVLLTFPFLQIQGVALDANGSFQITAPLPISPGITEIFLQAFVIDSGGQKGYSATNGVQLLLEQ